VYGGKCQTTSEVKKKGILRRVGRRKSKWANRRQKSILFKKGGSWQVDKWVTEKKAPKKKQKKGSSKAYHTAYDRSKNGGPKGITVNTSPTGGKELSTETVKKKFLKKMPSW